MVERYRRGKGKTKLLGNHQKCWIWGKNVVTETLNAGRWQIHEVRLSDTLPAAVIDTSRKSADLLRIPVIIESNDELTQRCHSAEHQGFLAKMAPFPYVSVADVLAEMPAAPLYVVLDCIQDPYNFGAIVRSAEVMGVDAIVIGEQNQVGVTSLVARTSAGAVNHIRIVKSNDLAKTVAKLKDAGIRTITTQLDAPVTCSEHDWKQPTALIIGNEGTGVSERIRSLADDATTIPQCGQVESLNAAVAAGILLYEARRQRIAG